MDFRLVDLPELGDITPQGRDWTVKLHPVLTIQSPPIVIAYDIGRNPCKLVIDKVESSAIGQEFADWLDDIASHIESNLSSKTRKLLGVDTSLDINFRIVDTNTCFVPGEEVELIMDFRGVTLKRRGDRFVGHTRFRILSGRNTGRAVPSKLFASQSST
jgi:hypothetical protein